MKIVVTGALGHIGSRLISELPTIFPEAEIVLIDNLSIKYFKKRNYLDGFLSGLRELEAQEKLTIHDIKRTHIGSLFIEGYSVVVWSPK